MFMPINGSRGRSCWRPWASQRKQKSFAKRYIAGGRDVTKVLVSFVQDRSGSMATVWDETLNGFTAFVKDLQENGAKDGVEYLFSLTTFDTLVETPCVAVPIEKVAVDEL